MKIEDIATKKTKYVTEAYAEAAILKLPTSNSSKNIIFINILLDTIVQFERKGFYIIDQLGEKDKPTQMIFVPDGKQKSMSTLKCKVGAE